MEHITSPMHAGGETQQEWVEVARRDQLGEDETLAIELDGREVCIYNVAGEILATDNRCTHGDADLSDGLILDGCIIECPLHEGTFNIRTGEPVGLPCTEALRCHDVRVDADAIFLRVRKA
jgi:nitrite reductase/ring-hydroxylating ferredoxin subunit